MIWTNFHNNMKFIFKKNTAILQFLKFAVVGAINTVIDLAVFNVLMWFTGIYKGVWIILISAASFAAANINSYVLNKRWTFRKETLLDRKKKRAVQFTQFFIVSLIGLGLNSLTVFIITTFVPPLFGTTDVLWANIAKIIAVGINTIWNFFGYKFLVFKIK